MGWATKPSRRISEPFNARIVALRVFHTVDLDRDAIRPGSEGPLATDRQARAEEQCSAGSRPRLCKLLRRQHSEREPSVDELGRQFVGAADAALAHFVEPDLTDVGKTLVDALKRASVEQVRRVHDVTTRPQVVGERAHPGSAPVCDGTARFRSYGTPGVGCTFITLQRHCLAGNAFMQHIRRLLTRLLDRRNEGHP